MRGLGDLDGGARRSPRRGRPGSAGPRELATRTSWPAAVKRRVRLPPMLPAPMMPIFMSAPVGVGRRRRRGAAMSGVRPVSANARVGGSLPRRWAGTIAPWTSRRPSSRWRRRSRPSSGRGRSRTTSRASPTWTRSSSAWRSRRTTARSSASGDAEAPFSVQSISKVFSLALVVADDGDRHLGAGRPGAVGQPVQLAAPAGPGARPPAQPLHQRRGAGGHRPAPGPHRRRRQGRCGPAARRERQPGGRRRRRGRPFRGRARPPQRRPRAPAGELRQPRVPGRRRCSSSTSASARCR